MLNVLQEETINSKREFLNMVKDDSWDTSQYFNSLKVAYDDSLNL